MANSGRMITGSIPKDLLYVVDKTITHWDSVYPVVEEMLFTKVNADKGFYEMMQLAGMGPAAQTTESNTVLNYDSVDQDWNRFWTIFEYSKSARLSKNAVADNIARDLIPLASQEIVKSLKQNRGSEMANILNRAFNSSYTGADGKVLCATDHPIQYGGTSTNTPTSHVDLSEDALEEMLILADGVINPDGFKSEYSAKYLVVPNALQFEACRILQSSGQTASANNDINAIHRMGRIKDYVVLKRLTSATKYFITTDAPNCLMLAQRNGIEKQMFNDPYTRDIIITASERFRTFFADWRGIVGSS